MTQTLFMIGARGAGKTTVGSALALALGYQFVDTDLFMQQAAQMSVAEMVEREGWLGFRRRETIALQTVTKPSTIVATGGGAILAEENRLFMRQHGTVIYLRAPASVLAQRLEEYPEDAQRPTLTGRPIAEEMREVLAAREALYQEAAHYVMDGAADPQRVVEQILAVLPRETVK
ncbi:shikimate kinase AroL [Serratia marcescens]|uniref:Shikimate kinase 2 n=1 Tax=Serratia marcescens TaxID=615 RepID=A0A379Y5X4_SERMA|nr:shikimate kinase AroL [Serratia marcescens]EGT0451868.1 shikimate kinase AroL [Serratia marcescens]KFD10596.1 shikimate kinase III [Serratia marcescens subsp. marcescens ATCC 13880]KFL05526.1 shikimate kinase 2 [Serratia marcescens]MBH3011395.1 shikimate kinase AroL [Serratia marcescens]MBH3278770.1 shikimate kinase AroL [Serratia marcescens]